MFYMKYIIEWLFMILEFKANRSAFVKLAQIYEYEIDHDCHGFNFLLL